MLCGRAIRDMQPANSVAGDLPTCRPPRFKPLEDCQGQAFLPSHPHAPTTCAHLPTAVPRTQIRAAWARALRLPDPVALHSTPDVTFKHGLGAASIDILLVASTLAASLQQWTDAQHSGAPRCDGGGSSKPRLSRGGGDAGSGGVGLALARVAQDALLESDPDVPTLASILLRYMQHLSSPSCQQLLPAPQAGPGGGVTAAGAQQQAANVEAGGELGPEASSVDRSAAAASSSSSSAAVWGAGAVEAPLSWQQQSMVAAQERLGPGGSGLNMGLAVTLRGGLRPDVLRQVGERTGSG